jgi:hypothetical protein
MASQAAWRWYNQLERITASFTILVRFHLHWLAISSIGKKKAKLIFNKEILN